MGVKQYFSNVATNKIKDPMSFLLEKHTLFLYIFSLFQLIDYLLFSSSIQSLCLCFSCPQVVLCKLKEEIQFKIKFHFHFSMYWSISDTFESTLKCMNIIPILFKYFLDVVNQSHGIFYKKPFSNDYLNKLHIRN